MTTSQAISGLICLNCHSSVHPGFGYCVGCGSTTLGYSGQVDVSAFLEEGIDTYAEQYKSGNYQAVTPSAESYYPAVDTGTYPFVPTSTYVEPSYANEAQLAYAATTGYPYAEQPAAVAPPPPIQYSAPVPQPVPVMPAPAAAAPPVPSFARISPKHRKPVKPELITERNKIRLLLARERLFLYMHIFIFIAVQVIGFQFAHRCYNDYIADEMTRIMMASTPLLYINLTGLVAMVPIRGTRKEIAKLKERLTYVLFQIEYNHLM
jgi:hypothetical protein